LCKDLDTGKKRGRRTNYREDGTLSGSSDDEKVKKEVINSPHSGSSSPPVEPQDVIPPTPLNILHQNAANLVPSQYGLVTPSYVPQIPMGMNQRPYVGESSELLPLDFDLTGNLQYFLSDYFLLPQQQQQQNQVDQAFYDTTAADLERMNEATSRVLTYARQRLRLVVSEEEADSIVNTTTKIKQIVRIRFTEHFGIPIAPNYYNMEHHKPAIEEYIRNVKTVFDSLGTACLAWDRSGLILYVNPSYKAITNWSLPVPVAKDASNLSYWTELSPKGFKNLLVTSNVGWEKLLSSNSGWIEHLPYCIFDTGVRYHGLKEQFVEGVMTVTFKLDPYGLPLVFIANFIPSTKL
jgi:PAS domain-containing protein